MLGSVADAEDAVQDAWLRWSAADRGDVADPRAYLVQITTRLALDRLDSARARRESYVGPWLPEPLLTGRAPVAAAPRRRAGGRRRARRAGVAGAAGRPRDAVPGRAGGLRAARGVRDAGRGGRRRARPHRGRRPADGAPGAGARAGPAAAVRRRPAGAAGGDRAVPRRRRRRRPGGAARRAGSGRRPDQRRRRAGLGGPAADRRRRQGRPLPGRASPRRAATSPVCGSRSPRSTGSPAIVGWVGAEPVQVDLPGAWPTAGSSRCSSSSTPTSSPVSPSAPVSRLPPPVTSPPPPRAPPSTSNARCASSPTPMTSTSAAPGRSPPGRRPAPRSPTASSPTATPADSTTPPGSRWARCGRPSSGPLRRRSASSDVRFLGYPDGRLELTLDLRRDISRVIRQVRPQRVLTSRRSASGTASAPATPTT